MQKIKVNKGSARLAQAMRFESSREYNKIMFLQEITHTVNVLNDTGDIVRLCSHNPDAITTRLPFSPITPHLHKQSAVKWCNALELLEYSDTSTAMSAYAMPHGKPNGLPLGSWIKWPKTIKYISQKPSLCKIPIRTKTRKNIYHFAICGSTSLEK